MLNLSNVAKKLGPHAVHSSLLFREFDGPPSWSLDASETGESTKCLWVGVVEGKVGKNRATAEFWHLR